MREALEQFLSELAKQPNGATGYWPSKGADINPLTLEQDETNLNLDERVASVQGVYADNGKRLIQLRVILN